MAKCLLNSWNYNAYATFNFQTEKNINIGFWINHV